jgi:hypothetical protein
LNVFVTTERVLGRDDNACAPDHSAGRTSGLGMNGDRASSGLFGGLRQGVG